MLPKKNRADKKAVDKIFEYGRFLNSPNLSFKFMFGGKSGKNISFIVPKSVTKSAVKRNLLRRRGYQAIEEFMQKIPLGTKGVFIFKKPESSISILQNEIKSILSKIN